MPPAVDSCPWWLSVCCNGRMRPAAPIARPVTLPAWVLLFTANSMKLTAAVLPAGCPTTFRKRPGLPQSPCPPAHLLATCWSGTPLQGSMPQTSTTAQAGRRHACTMCLHRSASLQDEPPHETCCHIGHKQAGPCGLRVHQQDLLLHMLGRHRAYYCGLPNFMCVWVLAGCLLWVSPVLPSAVKGGHTCVDPVQVSRLH